MSNKYEREIEELLRRLSGEGTYREGPLDRVRRRFYYWRYRAPRVWRVPRPSVGQWMLASFVLFLLSYFLRFLLPGLARVLGVMGIALFLGSFLFLLLKSLYVEPYTYWRGRRIELTSSRSWLQRLLHWWLGREPKG